MRIFICSNINCLNVGSIIHMNGVNMFERLFISMMAFIALITTILSIGMLYVVSSIDLQELILRGLK